MKYLNNNLFGKAILFATFLLLFLALPNSVFAQVSGKVYNDFNATATQTSALAEPGVADVIVQAIRPYGTSFSDTTDASGAYAFTAVQLPSGTSVRIEFSNLPTGAFDGVFSATAGSSGITTQFVTAGAAVTNISLGLSIPAMYCQLNPMMATPCYISGDPLMAGGAATGDVLVSFPYTASGIGTNMLAGFGYPQTGPTPQHGADGSQIGSTWGPGEPVLVRVTVRQYDSLGVLVSNSTLVTNVNGQFIFSSQSGSSATNFKYGFAIQPNTKHQVIIDAIGANAMVSGLLLTNVTQLPPGEVFTENSTQFC